MSQATEHLYRAVAGTSTLRAGVTAEGSRPVANFTGTPLSGQAPLTVSFISSSRGNGLSFAWNFGDGGTSVIENPTKEYVLPGTYTVVLVVTDRTNVSHTRTLTNYVSVS